MAQIEMISTKITLDLRYKTISLSESLYDHVLFNIYQKISTSDSMLHIIKDLLNNLDEDDSFILANELVGCRSVYFKD